MLSGKLAGQATTGEKAGKERGAVRPGERSISHTSHYWQQARNTKARNTMSVPGCELSGGVIVPPPGAGPCCSGDRRFRDGGRRPRALHFR